MIDRRVPTVSLTPPGPPRLNRSDRPSLRLSPVEEKRQKLLEKRYEKEAKLRDNLLTLIADEARMFAGFMNDRDVRYESSLVRRKQPRKRFLGIPYGSGFIEYETTYWPVREPGSRSYGETDYAVQQREGTEKAYQQLIIGRDGDLKLLHSVGSWALTAHDRQNPFIKTACMEDIFHRSAVNSVATRNATYEMWRRDVGQACWQYAGVSPANLFSDVANGAQP